MSKGVTYKYMMHNRNIMTSKHVIQKMSMNKKIFALDNPTINISPLGDSQSNSDLIRAICSLWHWEFKGKECQNNMCKVYKEK